jgi:uncharacterized protein YaaQ
MSQLLIAVLRTNHVDAAIEALVEGGFRVTGFQSFGGFLREDSRTLLLAVDDERVQDALDIFQRTCEGEEVEVPLVLMERLKDWREATVQHAGATIFIVPLNGIVRT